MKWVAFNLVLLGCYLGFFYQCLAFEFPITLLFGLAIAFAVAGMCIWHRTMFLNRYEFWFYMVLPLDIALESMIPIHAGTSFYFCAGAFWSVFVCYRVYRANSMIENKSLVSS